MKRSVLEFGAFGDGIHDDYGAFQAALDCGADTVIIPEGIYAISQTLKVSSGTHISAAKNAKIVMKSLERRKRNEFLLSNSDTENGNERIKISGGIWDGLNTLPENAKPKIFEKDGFSGALINLVNVKDLELCDMVLANTVTYYLRLCRVHNFKIENIDFVSDTFGKNQDGIHFCGDVKHGTVKNIRALSYGQTNDDMIALNADDAIERVENYDLCRDTIEDITFENIFTENCHTIVRILSVTAEIKNIHFKNVFGGFRCYAINADGARYCRTPIFNEDDHPEGVGRISNITFENFTCFPVLQPRENFGGTKNIPRTALVFESHMDAFTISNFRYLCSEEDMKKCPALKAKNLTSGRICADGKEYLLKKKSDLIVLENFKELSVSKIK